MPSEEHLVRQVEWKKKLEQYGKVELEKQLSIRGAKIFADVYAQIEGKEFIIEVGDIGDDRKNALLQLYAESKPNIVFIHEAYGQNNIQDVLEQINAYLHSPERQLERQLEIRKKIEELEKKKKGLPQTMIIVGICLSVTIIFFCFLDPPEFIPYLPYLLLFEFGLVVSLIFIGRAILEQQIGKIEQAQLKTAIETLKHNKNLGHTTSKEEEENEKEFSEHDITYGEDTWEQEDDEWTEELDSVDEMEW